MCSPVNRAVCLRVCTIVILMAIVTPRAYTQSTTCSTRVTPTLADATTAIANDAFARAEALLEAARPQDRACVELVFAHLAVAGWNAARAAAAHAGSPQSLTRPRLIVSELILLSKQGSLRYEIEYSRSLIAAAMAAAQDEREEMRVHLEQARWAHALIPNASSATGWPLPIDEAEGELWLEVDRFADAAAAYRRAAVAGRARAHAGLARSAAALGDTQTACESYRQWLMASTAGSAEQRQDAEHYIKQNCRSNDRRE